jgi:hypothetical protein
MSPELKKKKSVKKKGKPVQKKPIAKTLVKQPQPETIAAAAPELPDFTIDSEHSDALKNHIQEVHGGSLVNISL